jgi:phospholipid/cholesterol/gamma-HCH transport system substrate-binding protein
MRSKKIYFTVGIFVTVGLIATAVLIIWLGASSYFEPGNSYVTYFDESVQGLQIDSTVKYRGVGVGRVVKIGLAPDHKLVEVVMKIDLDDAILKNTVASLNLAGITGIVYVELDIAKADDFRRSPKLSFTPEAAVIPSRPSDVIRISEELYGLLGQVRQIDFKGLSDQYLRTGRSLDVVLGNEKIPLVVAHLESAANNLEEMTRRLNETVRSGAVDAILTDTRAGIADARSLAAKLKDEAQHVHEVLADAQATVTDARSLITRLKDETEQVHLAETNRRADRLLDNADSRITAIAAEIQISAENLHRASENLDALMERLREKPSDLIFSRGPRR